MFFESISNAVFVNWGLKGLIAMAFPPHIFHKVIWSSFILDFIRITFCYYLMKLLPFDKLLLNTFSHFNLKMRGNLSSENIIFSDLPQNDKGKLQSLFTKQTSDWKVKKNEGRLSGLKRQGSGKALALYVTDPDLISGTITYWSAKHCQERSLRSLSNIGLDPKPKEHKKEVRSPADLQTLWVT